MDKQVIWTFAGLNVNGERPMNLNVGVVMFVEKIFDDPSKPEVQNKIIEFKNQVETAKICGYSIRDISSELFVDKTSINTIEEAMKVANEQMRYVEISKSKGGR